MSSGTSDSPALLTVAVCTHNRAAFLCKCLDGLLAQDARARQFEILVVDNCSDDNTAEIVGSASGGVVPVRYAREERLGLSYARNRAIAESRSEYLAYIDDDAVPSPQWVRAILRGHVERNADGVAGRVLQEWPVPRPDWLPDDLLHYLGLCTLGEAPLVLPDNTNPVGGNMSFRRNLLEECGGFDVALGCRGRAYTYSAEEADVAQRLKAVGACFWYEPDATVYHYVRPELLTRRHFLRRGFWEGRTYALSNGRAVPAGRAFRKLIKAIMGSRTLRPESPARYFLRRWRVAYEWGACVELARIAALGYRPQTGDPDMPRSRVCLMALRLPLWAVRSLARRILRRLAGLTQWLEMASVRALASLGTKRPAGRRAILCIVHPCGLGDVLVTTPAIRSLKLGRPDRPLHVLTSSLSSDVLGNNPRIDSILEWNAATGKAFPHANTARAGFFDLVRLARVLRRLGFRTVVDFGSAPATVELARLAGAREMFGYRNTATQRWYAGPADDRYTLPASRNIAEWHQALAHFAGASDSAGSLEVWPTAADAAAADAALAGVSLPFVALFPHARCENKLWTIANWRSLIARIVASGRCTVVLLGAEDSREYLQQVSVDLDTETIIGAPLRVVFAIARRACACLALNSGPMHVAAAAGVPLIVLNGPSSELWAPWSTNWTEVACALECRPCERLECQRGDYACMMTITPEAVWSALQPLITMSAQARRSCQ